MKKLVQSWRGAVKGKVLLSCVAAAVSFSAKADQVFLEGFPDVPLLEGVEEQAGGKVVFDAPSGTVAETVIRASENSRTVLDSYIKELPVLGWKCDRLPQGLRCKREGNNLVFLDQAPNAASALIILRLEPVS